MVRYLSLGVLLLAAWVVSANTILKPYFTAPPEPTKRVLATEDAGALARSPAVLPMLTAPAIPQLAAATQPVTTEPVTRARAGTLPPAAEEAANSPVVTGTANAPVRLATAGSVDDLAAPVVTAPLPAGAPVRLATAAPTVGGADISDAAVIAKTDEPATTMNPAAEATAPITMAPLPRHRPRFAAIPLPRPRPNSGVATPVSFLERLFGVR